MQTIVVKTFSSPGNAFNFWQLTRGVLMLHTASIDCLYVSFFCISMTRVARWERVVGEGREKEKSLTSTVRLECSCGDTTRTCDLQVMSLASYQLLHSAMYLLIIG